MSRMLRARELQDLLGLARKLRDYAGANSDPRCVELFTETAESLESRALAILNEAPAQSLLC